MSNPGGRQLIVILLSTTATGAILLACGLLVLLSLGSGWTFPGLAPDRLDFAPWKVFVSDRDGLLSSVLTSTGISLTVGSVGTLAGLVIGRTVRHYQSDSLRFLVYVPFVIAPVVAGVCLYDLLIRVRIAGTVTGVVFCQSIFATSFAAVCFSELWTRRTDRLETLIRSLGGSTLAVWRHAVIPESRGLMFVCFLQTSLYSWLDYGLVSIVGGGNVQTLTSRMFGYIREASVNQAAQAALVLLLPAFTGSLITAVFYLLRRTEDHLN
jgi:putative spermidine/putrescine transport system permease protein